MGVKRDPDGRRWVSAEVEVPGTPEEVWEAIATGPGVSSWFVPTEIRDDGTIVSHFGPGMDAVAKQVAYEPPHRFVGEGEMGPGGPKLATEWIVEARSGSTCVVRVVHSLFASTDDWDDQLGGIEAGWPAFFAILRLYLLHFRGEPCSSFQNLAFSTKPPEEAWLELTQALGLGDAQSGEAESPGEEVPRLRGAIEAGSQPGHPHQLLLRLMKPAPGLAHLFAMGMGGATCLVARLYLYGDEAAQVARDEEPKWQAFLASQFPAMTPPDC